MKSNSLKEKNEFLVIGLVGAVGSRLKSLSNILNSLLTKDFNYTVEELRVSKEFLEKDNSSYTSQSDRYTALMNIGNNLRKEFGNEYLALKIVQLIAGKRRNIDGKNTKRKAFIINSLKHDIEIKTLREVYGKNFFQISLYESSNVRKDVLVNDIGMSDLQADELMKRDEGEENDYGQHTRDAFHLADYFIKFDNKTNAHIRNSCKRFLELIFGHPYITPTFNEFSMYMAYTASLKSSDLSRQVGAVISKDRNIIATGVNDIPKFGGGQYWPEYNNETGEIYDIEGGRDYKLGFDSNQREKQLIINEILDNIKSEFNSIFNSENLEHKNNIKKLEQIISKSPIRDITEYGRVLHAEMDAILACGRTNNSTIGSTIFVTTFPCHNCAKHILASGIEKVFFIEPYPKSKALQLWEDSMTLKDITEEPNKLTFNPFVGVGPRSFLDLFSISQGYGREILRKQEGNTIKWDSSKATLRLQSNVLSLNEIEKSISSDLSSLESK